MQSLRKSYLFSELDAPQFDYLLEHAQTRDLEADEILYRKGDAANGFFVVISGGILLYRVSTQGQEKIMRLVERGQSFAENIMFMHEPFYSLNARATQASSLVLVDTAAYLEVMACSFTTCLNMFARMAERIHSDWDEIEVLSLHNSRNRVLHYLLTLVSKSARGATTVTLPVRKAQIAAHLAITPETLSRVLHALGREALIEMQGYQVHIPSIAALRRA